MEIQWNGELNETYINEPIGNQTFHMAFQEEQIQYGYCVYQCLYDII